MAIITSNTFEVPASGASNPLSNPIVPAGSLASLFTYVGSFGVFGGGHANYSGGIGIDGSELLITTKNGRGPSGHKRHVSKWQIPGTFGVNATMTVPNTLITPGDFSDSGQSEYCTGIYQYTSPAHPTGRLICSVADTYDSNGSTHSCLMVGDIDFTGWGSEVAINGEIHGLDYSRVLAQGLGPIPAEWQTILQGDTWLQGCRMGIITNSCAGYGLGAFYADDVPHAGGTVNVRDWLWYRAPNYLEPMRSSPEWPAYPKNSEGGVDYLSITGRYAGCLIFVPGTRTLVFLTSHGYGIANNGCGGGSTHSDPNRVQIVAYDMADIIGSVNPHDPFPYGWAVLDNTGPLYGDCVGGATTAGAAVYDAATQRVYGNFAGTSVNVDPVRGIDVWDFNGWTP